MTIIIYYTEDKSCYQVIHPQMEGENHFRGDVRKLVEHVSHSNFDEGIRSYHSFEIIQ